MSVFDTYKTLSGYKMLNSFLNPEEAYKKAEKPVKAGWEEAKGFQTPFLQQGIDQAGKLNTAENSLLNPGELQNQWSQGYETSPYAQSMLEQNKSQGLDAASSMGLMGSSGALNNIQRGAGDIVSKDRQQYMDDLMKKYMSGIGIGQDIYNTGANTGNTLGNEAMKNGENLAGLEYGQYAAPGAMFGKLAGGAADMAANYYTGGAYGAAKNVANQGARPNTYTG